MHFFLKLLSGMANSEDPDQTDQGLHCLHMPFVRNYGVRNFRTFTGAIIDKAEMVQKREYTRSTVTSPTQMLDTLG